MLQTILRNLVGNALKYTASGGRVEASLIRQRDFYQIRINDNGIGIDADTRERLFRLDEKPRSVPGTHQETGTGLGLILCKEFVQRSGGNIGVESEPGKGATFWFTLPRAESSDITTHQMVSAQPLTLSILIADDRQISRETSGQMLTDFGHHIDYAENGTQAVKLAGQQTYDLILMDIDMPDISGIEATRQIRAAGYGGRIVAWSSYFRSEIEQIAPDMTFDGYLSKPLSHDELALELARLFTNID
jgi:CheY-like chemotaxis protein